MYKFKIDGAEPTIREYLRRHPNSKVAAKALNGDCKAMMELYKRLCGPIEQVVEDGPSDDAAMILSEAANCKYTPAMVTLAQVEMCQGDEYLPDGLNMLYAAMQLGDHNAEGQLSNEWYNEVQEWAKLKFDGVTELDEYQEYAVGFYYLHGICVDCDKDKAESFLLRSAVRDCKEAKALLMEIDPKGAQRKIDDAKRRDAYEKGCDAEDEHNPAKALKHYKEALDLGDDRAFRRILRVVEENTDPLQYEIESALKSCPKWLKVDVDDIDFTRQMKRVDVSDMTDADVTRLLRIVQKYNVLKECVDSVKDRIRDFQDAISNPTEMFWGAGD